MPSSSIVRFRPTGPWRFGPGSGAREQVDRLLHSDAVYSAVSSAFARLGMLEDWLAATARSESGSAAVRFSSLFPYHKETLFVVPPRSVWPPPPSTKVRYQGARFVPWTVVDALLAEKPLDEDRWQVDGESACLVPNGWHDGPFRTSLRSNAGVDRLDQGRVEVHFTACLEFTRDSGVWLAVVFTDDEARSRWETPIRSAFRLLADSGFGGERSRGWGRAMDPRWDSGDMLKISAEIAEGVETAYWLLSVYTPAESDTVDWNRGNYATLTRTGRIESPSGWGEAKAATSMLAEGSVLLTGSEPQGAVRDVAPEGFAHPVYRSGFPVAIRIPWRVSA